MLLLLLLLLLNERFWNLKRSQDVFELIKWGTYVLTWRNWEANLYVFEEYLFCTLISNVTFIKGTVYVGSAYFKFLALGGTLIQQQQHQNCLFLPLRRLSGKH